MMTKHLLSLVVLMLGVTMFIATSPDDKAMKEWEMALISSAAYPTRITLSPESPNQTVTVIASGLPIDVLDFVFTGTHQGNQSADITLTRFSEPDDSGGSMTEDSSNRQRCAVGLEMSVDFIGSISDPYAGPPFTTTYNIHWTGIL